jgi:hypothetical protein
MILKSFGVFLAIYFSSFSLLAARPVRGIYQVPVADHLAAYANYPVKYKADDYQEIPSELTFQLPSPLVGEPTYIQISKVPNTVSEWQGAHASGSCSVEGRYFICRLAFKHLTFDNNKIDEAIRFNYASPEEISGRTEVAKVFSAEPIGVLVYKLRGHHEH